MGLGFYLETYDPDVLFSGIQVDTDKQEIAVITDMTLYAKWEALPFICGDVNGDGLVNLMDTTILRRYAAGWTLEEIGIAAIKEAAADVNNDGEVNLQDASILRRYTARWSEYTLLPFISI